MPRVKPGAAPAPTPLVRPRVYLGIDPGASGGLACLSSGGSVGSRKMPESDQDLWEWFEQVRAECMEPFAFVEKVGGYHQGKAAPGSMMFNFGAGYGRLKMGLTAARVPFEEVTPQRWQRGLHVPPRDKGEGDTAWKNRLKAHAQRLFPQVKVTLAVADALLIAEFCKRSREGTL